MNCGIFSQNEWLFPDSRVDAGNKRVDLYLLKNQIGAFQVIITDIALGQPINIAIQGLDGITVNAYREKEVCVNRNANDVHNGPLTTDNWEDIARDRVRKAPYRTYDALVPLEGIVTEASQEVYYVTLCPSESAKSGNNEGIITFVFGEKSISFLVGLRVGNKMLPEQTLNVTNWFSFYNMARHHGLSYGSDDHIKMAKQYFDLLRECGNNVFWCTFDLTKAKEENGKITFDFTEPMKRAQFALDNGAKTLEWAPIISRPTWEDPPFLVWDYRNDTRGPNVLSTGGRKYFTAFLSQFNEMLTEKGWRDISIVHVSDEPKELCASDFRILCGIVRKYLPGIKLIDAIEIFFLQDALDIYVPKNHYFQMNRNDFEDLRDDRNEIWFYTCNMPGGRWLNRFIDSPLLNTRLLHWGNYRYNLTGYLHWGFNHLRDGQDPFEETSGNGGLPAGDTHIVYPYGDKVLRSLRLMQMKCGIQDYEILRALSLSDMESANKLCRRALHSFDDYITDVKEFDKIQADLVEAYDNV